MALMRTLVLVSCLLVALGTLVPGTVRAAGSYRVDCSPAPWPPSVTPDVFQMALVAKREAVTGDAAAQWLLGSLYLYGLGVPHDFAAGTKWIKTAADTASPTVQMSEPELFAIMLNAAEALPDLVRRDGSAWGIAWYKHGARTILQALTCPYDPSARR